MSGASDAPSTMPPGEGSDPAQRAAPFIGLKPFRAQHAALLFGRKRDAQLLFNKLFASPLTLLYAPSGVGKSSLLTGALIPRLKQGEDAVDVVYVEAWEARDPMAEIKAAVRALHLAVEGGSDSGVDERVGVDEGSLAAVLSSAMKARGRGVVLVLDQFEQFLIQHGEALQAFGAELGQALKLVEGIHVVLSLREEFLAGLQALRQHVPTLMASTYRLEYLAGDGARDAIVEPIKLFHATIDPDLVDALLKDLRADAASSAEAAALPQPGGIELPFLQLVCLRLWERSDKAHLTLQLYSEQLKGRKGIIESYVQDIASQFSEPERDQVAKVLDKLAPASGIKKLYLMSELAREAALSDEVTEKLLKRFEGYKVLRTRNTQAGVGYELYHDAFVAVLRHWIDGRLLGMRLREARAGRLRKLTWAGAGLLGLLVVLALVVWPRVDEWRRVERRIAQLNLRSSDADRRLAWNEVASYLWAKGDTSRKRLVGLLREHKDTVPVSSPEERNLGNLMPDARIERRAECRTQAADPSAGYSIDTSDAANGAGRGATDKRVAAPVSFTLSVHPCRALNPVSVFQFWRTHAIWPLTRDGVPVSVALRLVASSDPELSESKVLLERSDMPEGAARVMLTVVDRPQHLIVLADRLPKGLDLDQLLKWVGEGVEPLPWKYAKGWYVPDWTAPLWRAANVQVLTHEGDLALAFRDLVHERPELVLDDNSLDALLKRARAIACLTVQEAEAVRGGAAALREDLREALRQGQSLRDLAGLLDGLAGVDQRVNAHDALARLGKAQAEGQALPRAQLGPPRSSPAECVAVPSEAGLAGELPLRGLASTQVRGAIRVRIDQAYNPALAMGFSARAQALQALLYQRRGVLLPEIRLEPSRMRSGAVSGFDVALPGEAFKPVKADLSGQDIPAAVFPALQAHLEHNLARLVTAELVDAALRKLPAHLEADLRAHYALTDLKLMLRGMLQAPPGAEPQARQSMAQTSWLLGAVPFWETACPPRDLACMVQGMQRLQVARLGAPAPAPVNAEQGGVEAGVSALMGGDVEAARQHFRLALQADHGRTQAAYAQRWVAQTGIFAKGDIRSALGQEGLHCETAEARVGTLATLPLQAERDIEWLLASPAAASLRPNERLGMQLCLFESAVSGRRSADVARRWRALLAAGPAETARWPVDGQYRAIEVAMQAMRYGLIDDTAATVAQIKPLMRTYLASMQGAERGSAGRRVSDICYTVSSGDWCLEILREAHRNAPADVYLGLDLAQALGRLKAESSAREALQLADQVEAQGASVSAARQGHFHAWLAFARAQAWGSLADLQVPGAADKAAALYRVALAAKAPPAEASYWPRRDDIWSGLVTLAALRGEEGSRDEFVEADKLLAEWTREADGQPSDLLTQQTAFLLMAHQDREGLGRFVRTLMGKVNNASTDAQFAALVLALVIEPADEAAQRLAARYLNSEPSPDYADYIRMLWYWNQQGDAEARAMVANRWQAIDRRSWPDRLQKGDINAWRERLVGYYLGRIERPQLYEGLLFAQGEPDRRQAGTTAIAGIAGIGSENSQAFAASPMSHLGQSYPAMLSEAYFYDALKQSLTGDAATRRSRMREALLKTVAQSQRSFWEYQMAKYLLGRSGPGTGPG